MRRPFIAGNWKMNTTRKEAVELSSAIAGSGVGADCDVAVCVPFPHLGPIQELLSGSRVLLGAQDLFWEAAGAYTGQVSAAMLADYCSHVIIGHSERRHIFGETDEEVRRKLDAALGADLHPIVCIGETLEERKSGATEAALARQLAALAGANVTDRVTIAYEPVWAIGTGETATPEIAQEACAFARSQLREHFGEVAGEIRIQYGGSVNPTNAAELLALPDIDGALVGGASLKAEQFLDIVAAAPKRDTGK